VSEGALVYIARIRNLLISAAMLCFQIGLSFGLIFAIRRWGWPVNFQAAGPALALLLSVALTSVIKSNFLSHLLKARVAGWRWPMLWGALAAIVVGSTFTWLPKRLEWLEVLLGVPAIAGTYLFVIFKWALTAEDRALFKSMPKEGAVAPA